MIANLIAWFNPTRLMIVLGLALALLASFVGYGELRAHQATQATAQKYQSAIDKQKVEAAGVLAVQTRKVLALERELGTMRAQQEADYEKRRMDSRAAEQALAGAAARNGGRLRDPNAGRGDSCGHPEGADQPDTAGREGDPGEASGLLSVQLSDLLRRVLREADEINDAYSLCRADAIGVRTILERGDRGALQIDPEPEAANQPAR